MGDWGEPIKRWAPQRKMKTAEEISIENDIRARRIKRRTESIQKNFKIGVGDKLYTL